MSGDHFEDERVAAAHAALADEGSFEPVADEHVQLFADHDLASLVENRCGVLIEPAELDDVSRRSWIVRATYQGRGVGPLRSAYERRYWIRSEGSRVGTLALSTSAPGAASLRVSSVYVRPAARGGGLGRRAVRACYGAVLAAGLRGVRLETEWCWPRSAAFYLNASMWLRMWKRDLELVLRADLPRFRVDVDGDDARFVVDEDGLDVVVIEARRRSELLEWREHFDASRDGARGEIPFMAPGTFALALALRGWPLFTSAAARDAQLDASGGDFGGPDELAVRIRQWEAWTRHQGWRVETPRVPGVSYRAWSEEQ